MKYDLFISHASDDKDLFVRELAVKLKSRNIEIWYDEFTLIPGMSIRTSIDNGLLHSNFGVVIFSEAFFIKEWTQWELNGLIQKLHNTHQRILIPVWYNIDYHDIYNFSPSLADIIGIVYRNDVDEVVNKIMSIVRPKGTTLENARNILLKYGANPPSITDDWWIDIIEFMGTSYHMNRWGFGGIPSTRKHSRSESIAWAAMEMKWQEMADILEITQISEPQKVINFIESMPGLSEMCKSNISTLAIYAPQLTIQDYGGIFETDFIDQYNIEISRSILPRAQKVLAGSGLTVTGLPPKCSEELALRDSDFGEYKSSTIACSFINGPLMGPCPNYYEYFDYYVWLSSSNSVWLPVEVRDFLLEGIIEWNVWLWDDYERIDTSSNIPIRTMGDLHLAMIEADEYCNFILTEDLVNEIKTRIFLSKYYMNLEDSVDDLYTQFNKNNMIENWYVHHERRTRKHISDE